MVTYRFGDKVTLHQLGKPVTGNLWGANSSAVYLAVGNRNERKIKGYPFDSLDENALPVEDGGKTVIVVRDTHVRSKT